MPSVNVNGNYRSDVRNPLKDKHGFTISSSMIHKVNARGMCVRGGIRL